MDNIVKLGNPADHKIYKEECVYCFNNAETSGGLYVCLSTFFGLCPKHLPLHVRKTGSSTFLHRLRKRSLNPSYVEKENATGELNKLAINVDGGVQLDTKKYDFTDVWMVATEPDLIDNALTDERLPPQLRLICDQVIAAESAYRLQELESLAGTWDGSVRLETKHKDLQQLPDPPRISPSGWKCDVDGCDLTENLWLNLTSGAILCGRRFFDGSGGNHHAVEYWEKHRYPLAVKLGTITPNGADVYSYEEDDMVDDPFLAAHLQDQLPPVSSISLSFAADDMVDDPFLAAHLQHFGIKMMEMEKTAKTMLELELDLNQKYEWSTLTEEGSTLENVYGPGFTGIANLGSSCYINSSVQTLLQVNDVISSFVTMAEQIFASESGVPAESIAVQTGKLFEALASGNYSKDPKEAESAAEPLQHPSVIFEHGIRPIAFRYLIGRGHPEFSTKRQQDAEEFLRHFFDVLDKTTPTLQVPNPVDALRFEIEERTECLQSKKVAYKRWPETILGLPIPVDAVINKDEVAAFEALLEDSNLKKVKLSQEAIVRPKLTFQSIIEHWASESGIDGFLNEELGTRGQATRINRLATFPDYLLIQLQKFTINPDWTPKKLDIAVHFPPDDMIDLTPLRAKGRQPGEPELVLGEQSKKKNVPAVDETVVAALLDMGFPDAACRKAAYVTQNSGLEPATAWIMEHMGDADFGSPHPDLLPTGSGTGDSGGPSQELVDQLTVLGFAPHQAKAALKATSNDPNSAAMWLFENAASVPEEEPGNADPTNADASSSTSSRMRDSPSGKYRMIGFISHMGSSTSCGHYVCHLWRNGRWVIFNDEKVAYSIQPPKELGYIYLFQRC